ncbi:MAG: AAA family ATPase [Oscillospiraceae bacterium]|nr:AAA family ATPase [Oscillospiraceae bacterium]
MSCGIIICGANGSGKTTLGKALAAVLSFKHMDIEDYYFLDSDMPYSRSRLCDEMLTLMLDDIEKYGRFVLTAVNGDFGVEITSQYKMAVYLSAPLELRMERIKRRSFEKFGERMLKGGDMFEQENNFFEFAATRSMEKTKKWLDTLHCPVIYADGTKDIADNVKMINSEWKKICIN